MGYDGMKLNHRMVAPMLDSTVNSDSHGLPNQIQEKFKDAQEIKKCPG